MSIKYKYQSNGWRPELPEGRIIDIGGANSFAHGHLDALIDIRQPQASAKHIFVGNIDEPEIWDDVMECAIREGKWDYAICTHTLEDINNPIFAARRIQTIANAGLVIAPSKYQEFGRFSGNFRGYIHHRWIYDVIDGVLTAFPKINYIETMGNMPRDEGNELVVEWEGSIGLEQLNNGMPYGYGDVSGEEHIKQLYNLLLR